MRLFLLAPRRKSRRHHINKGWAWFEATDYTTRVRPHIQGFGNCVCFLFLDKHHAECSPSQKRVSVHHFEWQLLEADRTKDLLRCWEAPYLLVKRKLQFLELCPETFKLNNFFRVLFKGSNVTFLCVSTCFFVSYLASVYTFIIVLDVYCQITFGSVYALKRRTQKRLGMKRSLKLVLLQCVIIFLSPNHLFKHLISQRIVKILTYPHSSVWNLTVCWNDHGHSLIEIFQSSAAAISSLLLSTFEKTLELTGLKASLWQHLFPSREHE